MANFSGLFDKLKRKGKGESDEKKRENIDREYKPKTIENYISKNKVKICIDGVALQLLTKLGMIENVVNFYDVAITSLLADEIDKQKKDNEQEANYLLNLINTGKISVAKVHPNKDLVQYGLYGIELEIVSHFLNGNCDYILADDAIIRVNREILKLRIISTPAFILSLLDKEIIRKEQAISAYAILRSEKWFEEWTIDECIRRVKMH